MKRLFNILLPVILVLAHLLPTTVKAELVETELRKLLRDYNGFKANFSQQVTDSDNNLLHQAKGSLVFKQPSKFKWQVIEPENELLLSDGTTLWWYNPFLEQVSIFDAKDAVATTPFALLVSNNDETWNQFDIEKIESGFRISPKNDDSSQVKSLVVIFDGFLLTQIAITDRTMQKSVYELSQQEFDTNLKTSFSFDVPSDVEIDDQRQHSN